MEELYPISNVLYFQQLNFALYSPILSLWAANDPQHLGSGKKARFAAPVNPISRFPTHLESNTAPAVNLH